jgi:hypothetical protein
MTYDRAHDLRQGCLLVGDPEKPTSWEIVLHSGKRETVEPDSQGALAFAKDTAKTFGVGKSRSVSFDPRAANAALKEKGRKGKKGG